MLDDNQGMFSFSSPCRVCGGQGSRIEDPCPTCRGTGVEQRQREVKTRIPAGVKDGQTIRLKGRGGPGRNGGPAGDLLVELKVMPHPLFGRSGDNLTVSVPITVAEAALVQRRLPAARRGRPWLTVLVVLAAAIFLQAVAERRPLRVDLTPSKLYSLAPQTEQILHVLDRERTGPEGESLPAPRVEVLAFYHNLDGARQNIQALLQSVHPGTHNLPPLL